MRHTPAPAPISRDRLQEVIGRYATLRVAVVGDVMLDRYLVGDAERLSPEAPVPVVVVREQFARVGGAGNVAMNVTAMGARCQLVGAVGDDAHADALRAELVTWHLDDAHLVTVPGRPTTTKTRLVARGQQVVRIDEEVDRLLEGPDRDRLIEGALAAARNADVLLLQDYNKGVLTAQLIRAVMEVATARGIPVIVDPKYRQFFAYAGATVFKPNRRELEMALGAAVDLEHQEALPGALSRLGVANMLVTLGADGMVLVASDGTITHIQSLAREVYDVSGAGDTVTAWLGVSLAAGATVREAAIISNYAAGIEVGKLGVATVSPDEVLREHEARHDQIGLLRRGGVI